VETTVLSTALDKLKGLAPDVCPSLSEEEARALSGYLSKTASAEEVTDAEQLLCRRIREVLQARAAQAHLNVPPASAQHERTNNALRAAIDLFLARDFAHVQDRDVKLLREADAALQKMAVSAEPSANQIRLAALLSKCLSNYSAWVTDQPRIPAGARVPPAESVAGGGESSHGAAPESNGTATWNEDDLRAAAGQMEQLESIEEVPLSRRVRRAVHEGDLVLAADCPDDILLVVQGGCLTVTGSLSGVAVADGDIKVAGNVQGGWAFARRGKIAAGRVLSTSSLIAPRGDLALSSVENAALLYCGGNCRIAENAFGMTVYANDLLVVGTVRNARIWVRGRAEAGAVEMSPRDETAIRFRAAQSCFDYGRPIPETSASGLRQLARLYFRCHTTAALIRFFESERLSLCRARLLALRANTDVSPVLRAFRGGHAVYAGLQYIIEICESLKEAIALGESLGGDYTAQLLRPVLEEAAAAVAAIARETAGMGKEYVPNPDLLDSPCRHINSFCKKLKEAQRAGAGLDKLFHDMDLRLDEWRETAARERVAYSGSLPAIVEVLGERTFELTDCDQLNGLSARLEGQVPEARLRGVELRIVKEKISQYGSAGAQWRETAETLRLEYTAAVTEAAAAMDLVLARRGDRGLRAGEMAYGVPVRTLDVAGHGAEREGTPALLTEALAPYELRCEHLRLYRTAATPL